jgi:hypothetical protein
MKQRTPKQIVTYATPDGSSGVFQRLYQAAQRPPAWYFVDFMGEPTTDLQQAVGAMTHYTIDAPGRSATGQAAADMAEYDTVRDQLWNHVPTWTDPNLGLFAYLPGVVPGPLSPGRLHACARAVRIAFPTIERVNP